MFSIKELMPLDLIAKTKPKSEAKSIKKYYNLLAKYIIKNKNVHHYNWKNHISEYSHNLLHNKWTKLVAKNNRGIHVKTTKHDAISTALSRYWNVTLTKPAYIDKNDIKAIQRIRDEHKICLRIKDSSAHLDGYLTTIG